MFGRFKTRSSKTERLDRGDFTRAEYRRWQKEMWYIHRFFGEVRALKRSLLREIHEAGEHVSVLDIAAGSGELLEYIAQTTNPRGLFAVGAESSFAAATTITGKGINGVRCDALDLPFAPDSFDFVFCTLFLHHLDYVDSVRVIEQMASIARRKFFVIDLDRRPIPYFAYRIVGRLLLQRFTREDGALSILRSHRPSELERIAHNAGLKNFEVKRSAINRLILSANA